VHQYGREGAICELYGVTGWGFDFRGHKFQGDWLSALGVTTRVHHLSWLSMKGDAKRDFPASIHYQSSWYEKYKYVEDHFARVNTALTRGKPVVKLAVLHPIESYWLSYGAVDVSAGDCATQEERFQSLAKWLLSGTVDFDYLSESTLPTQYTRTENKVLKVGEMEYTTVLVPPMRTIRQSTLDILQDFVKRGGKVIFAGEAPTCVNGALSKNAQSLYASAEKCAFERLEILAKVNGCREVSIRYEDGKEMQHLLYNMREDSSCRWLFIARFVKPSVDDYKADNTIITLKGNYKPTVYDTLTGKIYPVTYKTENGKTVIPYSFYAHDSLLLKLEKTEDGEAFQTQKTEHERVTRTEFTDKVEYTLSEPNVLLLDMFRYSWDKKNWSEKEETLRLDRKLRSSYEYPLGRDCQPWAIPDEAVKDFPYLKFEFNSTVETECTLAYEEATEIEFNGERVEINPIGYFVDKAIKKTALPKLKRGKNVLIVRVPLSKRIGLENMFILGDFAVKVEGATAKIVKRENKISFGSITSQGLPFYGGAITYRIPVNTPDCALRVQTSLYTGAVISAKLDGKEIGNIAYAPYTLTIENVEKGKHLLELTLYATRENCFGYLHYCARDWKYIAPAYAKQGEEWSYEYVLKATGIEKSPVIEILKK